MPKAKYAHVFCSACRMVILCPIDAWSEKVTHPPGWIETADEFFCSADCQKKGPAVPVRDRAPIAHIRMEPMTPDEQRGFNDALLGYDCVGHRPNYVHGHANGMSMRAVIEAAVKKLEESQ